MKEEVGRDKGGKFTKNAPGRPKGAKNKITLQIKSAFDNLTYNNLGEIQDWLDRVAVDNPAKALELYLKLSERVIPTLSKSEEKIELDNKVSKININIKRKADK